MKDDKILKSLRNKIQSAQQYLNSYYVTAKWEYFDNLYFCKREKASDAEAWRMNVFVPVIWQTISDILPRFIDGIFGSNGFTTVLPMDKDSEKSKIQALSQEKLMDREAEIGGYDNAKYNASNYALRYGIGWMKVIWEYDKDKKEYFDIKKNKLVEVKKEITVNDNPVWYAPDPRSISWNPDARCYDDIRYIVENEEIRRETLEDYKEKDVYDSKIINEILADSGEENEDDKKIFKKDTVYERNYLSVVINDNYIIRRHKSPYKNLRGIPFFPVTYWKEPDKIVSRGIIEILADLQDYINDIINLKGDNLTLSVNKTIAIKEGVEIADEDLRLSPGSAIYLDDPQKDIKVLDWGNVHNEAFTEIEQMLGLVTRTMGTAPSLITPEGGQDIANKTATAARILTASLITKLSVIIKPNIYDCVKPMTKWVIDMNEQYMTKDRAKEIVGDRLAKELKLEYEDESFNVDYDYVVTGQDGAASREEEVNMALGLIEILSAIPNGQAMLNGNALVKRLVNRLDIPKEVINDLETAPEAPKLDVNAMPPEAQGQMDNLAATLGRPKEDLIKELEAGKSVDELINEAQVMEQNIAGGMPV